MQQALPQTAKEPFTIPLNDINTRQVRITHNGTCTAITKDLKKQVEGLQLLLGLNGKYAEISIDFSRSGAPFISEIAVERYPTKHQHYDNSSTAFKTLTSLLEPNAQHLIPYGGYDSVRDAEKNNAWRLDGEALDVILHSLPAPQRSIV